MFSLCLCGSPPEFSGFLPLSKNMQLCGLVMLDCPTGVNECMNVRMCMVSGDGLRSFYQDWLRICYDPAQEVTED